MSAGEEARTPLLSGYERSSDSGNVFREYPKLHEKIDAYNDPENEYGDDLLTTNPIDIYSLFSNITLHQEGGTLSEEEVDMLYAELSTLPLYKGRRLKKRIIDDTRIWFENSSQGTSRDLNLLELQLQKEPDASARQEIVDQQFDSNNGQYLMGRILSGKKSAVAMMRLCKFISKEKLKSTKCDEEFNRLLSSKYNPAEIDALSDQPPNMHEITFDEFNRRFVQQMDKYLKSDLAKGHDFFIRDDESVFEQPKGCFGLGCFGLGGRTKNKISKKRGMRRGTRKGMRKGMRKGTRKGMRKGTRKEMRRGTRKETRKEMRKGTRKEMRKGTRKQ